MPRVQQSDARNKRVLKIDKLREYAFRWKRQKVKKRREVRREEGGLKIWKVEFKNRLELSLRETVASSKQLYAMRNEAAIYRRFFGGPVLTIASYSGKVGSSFRDTGET